MNLLEIRSKIDKIDDEILALFNKRMELVKDVALYKKSTSTAILNTSREQDIIDRVVKNSYEFATGAKALFTTLMEVSRAYQYEHIFSGSEFIDEILAADKAIDFKNKRIGCTGPFGANSHIASNLITGSDSPVFYEKFKDIFIALLSGDIDFGVLPVENSNAGSVYEIYDLLLKFKCFIVGAEKIAIFHHLATCDCSSINDINMIYSHPQALAQCSEFIDNINANITECSSTSAAALMVRSLNSSNSAAICTDLAATENGLKILKKNIQNNKENFTRFIVISRKLIISETARKISISFSLPHTAGALYQILARFALCGLNLTKIESRPKANINFEYTFFVDFCGNITASTTLSLLSALNAELPDFRLLGCYFEE